MGYKDFNDKRPRPEQYREDSILYRKLFLSGIEPFGFIFLPTSRGNSFHLLKNNEETYCNKSLLKYRQKHKKIVIIKELKETPNDLKKRVLCLHCENRYLGLHRGEQYKRYDNHISLFMTGENQKIISKKLLHLLKHPKNGFPTLKIIKIKNFKIV